jgi:hypothetical protein
MTASSHIKTIIFSIAFSIIIVVGFFAWQWFGAQKEVIKDETAGWKTYTNEQYGFEIRYPENISIIESSSGVRFDKKDENCENPHCPVFMFLWPIYISSSDKDKINQNTSLEDLLQISLPLFVDFKEFQISQEESSKYGYIDLVKKVNFGNVTGYLVHKWTQATGECHYFAKQREKTVDIVRSGVGSDLTYCGKDDLFNQMLSTFLLLE